MCIHTCSHFLPAVRDISQGMILFNLLMVVLILHNGTLCPTGCVVGALDHMLRVLDISQGRPESPRFQVKCTVGSGREGRVLLPEGLLERPSITSCVTLWSPSPIMTIPIFIPPLLLQCRPRVLSPSCRPGAMRCDACLGGGAWPVPPPAVEGH